MWLLMWLQSKKDPYEFAEELVKEADQYNGFNLIIADLCSMTMVYVTNRPKEGKRFNYGGFTWYSCLIKCKAGLTLAQGKKAKID